MSIIRIYIDFAENEQKLCRVSKVKNFLILVFNVMMDWVHSSFYSRDMEAFVVKMSCVPEFALQSSTWGNQCRNATIWMSLLIFTKISYSRALEWKRVQNKNMFEGYFFKVCLSFWLKIRVNSKSTSRASASQFSGLLPAGAAPPPANLLPDHKQTQYILVWSGI